jgi:hypothetical protein
MSVGMTPTMADPHPGSVETDQSVTRRAIVCFVGDKRHLIQQVLALRLSWRFTNSPDTDLVVMGPEEVLAQLPDDLVKIAQRSVEHDPEWHGYRFIDSVACFNGAGAEQLDRYSHILRTDVDTFITPAWNQFFPTAFTMGPGFYSNDDEIRQCIRDIATEYGLRHQGLTDVGSTWYGPTAVVRRAAAFTEMLTKHILSHYFLSDEGQWPSWSRGVAFLYAGEIAVNHCAPDAQFTDQLDFLTDSPEPISRYAHIHCWHTEKMFSKHTFMAGGYSSVDPQDLDMDVIREYCLALSLRSLETLVPVP